MLTVEGLAVFRGDDCLFRKLGFTVPAGAALQLTGPNGSGKTTLLRVLAGFLTPEAGRIRWGSEAGDWTTVSRGRIAFSGHLGGIKAELTAAENLAFSAALAGAEARVVGAALAAAGLARCASIPAAQLSAGQRRRLALARLPLSRAPLWLLDEPQTNLDEAGKEYLRGLLAKHLAAGGLAVIASHEPAALGGVANACLQLGNT